MAKKDRYMIVFDFETDGLKAATGYDNITQIGAVAVDLRTLEVEEGSEFNIVVCPDEVSCKDFDFQTYYQKHKGALDKHAEWTKSSAEAYVDKLSKDGVPEKDAVKQFVKYCANYKRGGMPTHGGQNTTNFDIPILEYLVKKHKTSFPFGRTDRFDLRDMMGSWFLYSNKPPKSYSMGAVRPYFGVSEENAHDALQDVIDTAGIIIRFLKLHKQVVGKVQVLNGGVVND